MKHARAVGPLTVLKEMISLIEQQDFFVGRRRAFGKDGCNLFFGLSDPFGEDVTACLDNELPAKVMGQKMRQIGFPVPGTP